MADRIKINDIVIKQPLSGLGYGFTKKYSRDSTHTQSGREYTTTVGVYEQFNYSAANLTEEELSTILRQVLDGEVFTLHYRSAYYGGWRDDEFKVEAVDTIIGSWVEEHEVYESLSFKMTGVNPLG